MLLSFPGDLSISIWRNNVIPCDKSPTATDAIGRLVCKAKELVILGCLTENEKRRTADTITISRKAQRAWKRPLHIFYILLCGISMRHANLRI